MKEIKFRAWVRKLKVWADSVCVYSDGSFSARVGNVEGYDSSECDLVEYTGLKDKQGKEIYEGDIVRIKQYNYDCEWRLCTLTLVSPITFTSDCQFFPTKLVNNRLWEPDTEIIGNIYENPELLEALDEQDR